MVFHDPDKSVVIAADAAGMYIPSEDIVKPTAPPVEFDPDQAIADIRRIADLEPDTL